MKLIIYNVCIKVASLFDMNFDCDNKSITNITDTEFLGIFIDNTFA